MYLIRLFNIRLLKRKHTHYTNSGFYGFLTKNVLKVVLILVMLLIVFFMLEKWVIDLDGIFSSFFKNMSNYAVFLLFAISESLFGLIPPDFFIMWARHFNNPWLVIGLLAVISYLGGIVSYLIGRKIRNIERLNAFVERKFGDHFKKVKLWGAVFIIVAALFPLPYSMVCMISGTLKFPWKVFLIIGSTRILRFYFYALVLHGIILLS